MKALIIVIASLFVTSSASAQILISEIMYDPAGSDSGQEWIEIYNNDSQAATIGSGWRFIDSSAHLLQLYQGTSTLAAGEFAIVADNAEQFVQRYPSYQGTVFDSVVNLNNSSSSASLSIDSAVIDRVAFNASWGASGNDKTLERKDMAAGNDQTNWQQSYQLHGTPGQPASEEVIDEVPPTNYQGVIINEILPNPAGDDASQEWIELYNEADAERQLLDLLITDGTNSYPFGSERIASHGYLLLPRSLTGIALNNTSDHIQLVTTVGEIIDQADYSQAVEAQSWARQDDRWLWTAQLTPDAVNIFPLNQKPLASASITADEYRVNRSISFDASASTDPEGKALAYLWDFADGQTSNRKTISHKYSSAGSYTVLLRVTDAEGLSAETTYRISITDASSKISSQPNATISTTPKEGESALENNEANFEAIIVTEFVPNPIGSDDQEWIELYNSSQIEVDVSGFMLDDADGGSKPFRFPQGTKFSAGQYQVWSRLATKLALNNDKDSLRLLTATGQEITAVTYDNVIEGNSYALNQLEDEWHWTDLPTPGNENLAVLGLTTETLSTSTSAVVLPDSPDVISAQVIVPPGLWYKQRIYVRLLEVDDDKVWEVYLHSGNFASLPPGSQIQIIPSSVDESKDIPRIKISTPEQIVSSSLDPLDWPTEVALTDIDQELIGYYVTVRSAIQKINKRTVLIGETPESGLSVYLHPNIDWSEIQFEKDYSMLVRGIIMSSGSDLVIRPITIADIQVEQRVDAVDERLATSSEILSLPPSTPARFPWLYFGSAGALVGGYIIWQRRSRLL